MDNQARSSNRPRHGPDRLHLHGERERRPSHDREIGEREISKSNERKLQTPKSEISNWTFPLLSEEGWMRCQENVAKHPLIGADGVVPARQTPPRRLFLRLRAIA